MKIKLNKQKIKGYIFAGLIGGACAVGALSVFVIANLDKIIEKHEIEVEDFIFDSIKTAGFIQLEHSKTNEPMVICEDRRA